MRNARVGVLIFGVFFGVWACGDAESEVPPQAGIGGSDASTSGDGGANAGSSGANAAGSSGANAGSSGANAGGSDASIRDSGEPDAGHAARPHPLYAALDLAALPGPGGAASGPYTPPALPETTRTLTAQSAAEIAAACQTPGTHVMVPSAVAIGTLDLGHVEDCDIELGPDVVIQLLYMGHLPGPMIAPLHRVRVRGGQIGHVMVDPGSTDIVLDGVTINSGVMPAASRPGVAIYLINQGTTGFVERFAVVRSVIRMVATEPMGAGDRDGAAYLAGGARNVFFADNNIVTAGNRNSWGFRIGGGDNFVAVDNVVRVSFHKLIRMNDGPVDYVYVRGGVWMREQTLTAGGDELNDGFAQLGDLGTDNIFIHDTAVHLRSDQPISFGASFGPGQAGKSWQVHRIAWHARSASVISDMHLTNLASGCTDTATCDYGVGTHSYVYDEPLAFPDNPWRELPNLAEDDPDALPTR